MPQPFTPNAMDEALGFTGAESDEDFSAAASGTEDDAPEPETPAPAAPEAPAPETPAPPAPEAVTPAAPQAQPSLADILALMERQNQAQTQILERAIPKPPPAPPAPRPLPAIPAEYAGAIDEDTLRGAQVVMDILGITPKLERLEAFEQNAQQRESSNGARNFIISQVPEMAEEAFQNEVASEVERTFDAAGIPKEQRGQFLNPLLFVQAGNAVKARRSQSAASPAAPPAASTQSLAARSGGETRSGDTATSVADASEQPTDWLDMSEEDFAKRQAAILKKQGGGW